ncbi:hypothetical protein CROQUDRAFT_315180 [Cronartium quercuum f. sp. fusiforme G11]|uniref:Uncharacterized protein n=1 Tax=Cronartium quercuum f. sp. fusiforme G11 TaxID=708437 RepID=A0A9P6NRS1_9BASI|nr:hypothetical protein CROQUDRAFT_315180 [Cronartium quercuum f. sp. fusiforme G11]
MEMDQLMAAQANLELDLAQLSNMISSLPPPPPPPSAPENNSDGLLPVEEEEEEEAETSTSWNGNEEQINQLQAHIIQRVPSPPVNKQMGAASAGVSDELAAAFEPIFTSWLGRLCSDLDMKDSKGEPIHQTLMARKMQRLEESADFRPFKFRIQAFTNAFFEELVRCGFSEKDLPMKKVRQYLWSQTCISRFNEEGKKAKSKGNHVWHIEAQKIVNGQWNFLHFQRKIVGTPSNIGYIGKKWIWQPKVWDPQCSAHNIRAHFSTKGNGMPTWLSWKDNVLSGIPTFEDLGQQYEFLVVATTNHNSRRYTLKYPVKLEVRSADELDLVNSGPSTSTTTTASGGTFEQQQQVPSGNAFEQSTGSFEANTGVFEQVPRGAFEPPPPGTFEQPQPGGFEQSNSAFEQSSTTFESTSTTFEPAPTTFETTPTAFETTPTTFKQPPPPVTFEQVTTGVAQFDQTPTSTTTTATTTSSTTTTTDQMLHASPSSLYNNFNSSSSHEVRLATVRDDLLKGDPDTYVSAGRIVREAIVSEDPLERQFAAEVLKQAGSTGFGQEGLG